MVGHRRAGVSQSVSQSLSLFFFSLKYISAGITHDFDLVGRMNEIVLEQYSEIERLSAMVKLQLIENDQSSECGGTDDDDDDDDDDNLMSAAGWSRKEAWRLGFPARSYGRVREKAGKDCTRHR